MARTTSSKAELVDELQEALDKATGEGDVSPQHAAEAAARVYKDAQEAA